jgi:DeoR/GlpR family transcriptional regulator of sugar metabolism
MIPAKRHEQIIKFVNKYKTASVEDLSDLLKISKVTVRRDLDELSAQGLVLRTYGGATSVFSYLAREIPSNEKSSLFVEEKRRIGKAAASLINDDDVIVLDSGTTTLEIARNLNNRVTVITNDLKIAMELCLKDNVTLYITGGLVENNLFSTTGKSTENFFNDFHADKTFLAADAISLKYGITNRTVSQVPIKRAIALSGALKVLVTDHSKFEKETLVNIGLLDEIDIIITDQMADEIKKKYEELGKKIILA